MSVSSFSITSVISRCAGHGTIGLVASLAWLERIKPGKVRIETTVGIVTAELLESGDVVVANVPSYRARKAIPVDVPGIRRRPR